jgi:hypothetical protein
MSAAAAPAQTRSDGLIAAIDRLVALTRAERQAVMRLDTKLLDAFAHEKAAVLDGLRVELAARRASFDVTERRRLDLALRRLAIESEAQVALFQDARDTLEAHVGMSPEPATYDGRARLVRARPTVPAPGI